jgi:hypothetical protein
MLRLRPDVLHQQGRRQGRVLQLRPDVLRRQVLQRPEVLRRQVLQNGPADQASADRRSSSRRRRGYGGRYRGGILVGLQIRSNQVRHYLLLVRPAVLQQHALLHRQPDLL